MTQTTTLTRINNRVFKR